MKYLMFFSKLFFLINFCIANHCTDDSQITDIQNNTEGTRTICCPVYFPSSSSEILEVINGGTGLGSVTAYAVLCGGVTPTSALQTTGPGTSGHVLTSNGPSSLPTFQSISDAGGVSTVNVQIFTSSGTYTPTSGMKYCIVECIGGGGGAGGINASSGGTSPGAGSGSYSLSILSAATIGTSQAVTIGAGGLGGAAGTNPGNPGGTTTFGSTLVTAPGGLGSSNGSNSGSVTGSNGGVTGTGTFTFPGRPGGVSSPAIFSGYGGSSFYGAGGTQQRNVTGNGSIGADGTGYGAGGGGPSSGLGGSATNRAGGTGSAGIVIVTEFI